ncbi:MAG TPA: archaeal proteasome endopeptidase complex subunit alpha [Methanosarcinales archaeon]|nr:archaeal proteasome endopeptidase complex subunit alpha [Methanosarcinales archaeon]
MQMAPQMGYDRAITVFSPDGRLFQVEYAREAVKRGTTAIGIKTMDGVILLVDKRITSHLLESESIEKIFQIDLHIGAATSGLVADARALIDRARVEAQVNRLYYDESIGVETLAKRVCDHKQTYTQYGGVRPYGTALLIAGVDDQRARLFETDPSGALLEYKATAIGAGRAKAMEIFEKEYVDDIDMESAIRLGLVVLYQVSDAKFTVETVEAGCVTLDDRTFKKIEKSVLVEYVEEITREFKDQEQKGQEQETQDTSE